MIKRAATIKNALLDLIYPMGASCAACGNEALLDAETGICEKCFEALAPNVMEFRLKTRGGIELHAAAPLIFNDESKSLIHTLKYDGGRYMAKPLGAMMAFALLESGLTADVIVPIPLYPRKLKERGYNQSMLLAAEVGHRARIPCVELLTRVKDTATQTKLSAAEREENVKDAFKAKDSLKYKDSSVILVDDVCTTGTTARECAGTLLAAGVKSVICLFAAKTT